jgi:hypothetical protein
MMDRSEVMCLVGLFEEVIHNVKHCGYDQLYANVWEMLQPKQG